MKRILKELFVVAIALILLFSLTGCGEKENNNEGTLQQEQGTAWPSNEYTDLIPFPEGATIYDDSEINNAYYVGHNIDLQDWTIEECKSYAEKLKEKGFTTPGSGMNSVVITDTQSSYSFGAKNSDGVYVTVGSSYNSGRISIQKNKDQ